MVIIMGGKVDVATRSIRIASVCSGVGGIDLGLKIAIPNSRTVLYCEKEAFPAAVLVARMEEEILDSAPIWLSLIHI